jgi:hypothetical protein
LNVARFLRRQLSEGVSGVFHELHLSKIRAQRLGCGSDCGNRGMSSVLAGVSSFLGSVSRLFGSVSKRFPLLSG